MITFDTHELAALGVELGRTGLRVTPVMTDVFEEATDQLTRKWADLARASSGEHGKHYPDSIDSERVLSSDIVFEVGPNPAKPQGRMAFESGSVNQPPHPDGQMAADTTVPALARRIDAALGLLDL